MLGLFLAVVHFSYSQNDSGVLKKDEYIDVGKIEKKKFHLYLLAGQSNMAGRGIVENQESQYSTRILTLDKNGLWKIAKEPIHFDKPEAGVGPGLAFAKEMLETEDFHWLGQEFRKLGVPLFSLLEGGYSDDLPELILAYLKGLNGQ